MELDDGRALMNDDVGQEYLDRKSPKRHNVGALSHLAKSSPHVSLSFTNEVRFITFACHSLRFSEFSHQGSAVT